MTNLTDAEREALKVIANGSPLMQSVFPDKIVKRLLDLRLLHQTLGGTLTATEEGFVTANPEAVATVWLDVGLLKRLRRKNEKKNHERQSEADPKKHGGYACSRSRH